MEVSFGKPEDLPAWMALVRRIRAELPGLETEEQLLEHETAVRQFLAGQRGLCVHEDGRIAGVLLFSRAYNMICCLAVLPEYRRRGMASALLAGALRCLDPGREVSVTTFRASDPRGAAPRALYRRFGFRPSELTEEFDAPAQVFRRPPDVT